MKRAILFMALLLSMVAVMFIMIAQNPYQPVEADPPKTKISDASSDLSTPVEVPIPNETQEDVKKQEPEPVITKATLAAVGDVLIHKTIYQEAKKENEYDFKPMFELVKPFIEHADIAIANQETMIGGSEIGLSTYPRFNSPFEIGDALKEAGFDIVSLANNHTLDRGEQAIQNAIGHWNKLGMAYTGAYSSEEDRDKIRTIEKNGIVFSFLSYTYGTNGVPIPKGKDYLVNLIEMERIKADVADARTKSDVVVASMHFGIEYENMPNDDQKSLVDELANAGVDIIIGHHSHVLQPIEWIEKEDGKRSIVVYSLGNFLAAQDSLERELGGIFQIEVEKTTLYNQSEIILKNPSFIPTLAYKKKYRNYKIIPLEQVTESQLVNAVHVNESVKSHMSQWVEELLFPSGAD